MKIAIQGELGSNSHMAVEAMLGQTVPLDIVGCSVSAEAFEQVVSGGVEGAVLPIENSLHGSVAEHYDLLLSHPVRIVRESLLRIRHCLITCPGVAFEDLREVLSHPVALAQCRRFLAANRQLQVVPFYDTAGSVKAILAGGMRHAAAIAPPLAATEYGAEILRKGLEDHEANYTRFHLLVRDGGGEIAPGQAPNKMSLALALDHRPGSLVLALEALRLAGVNLTKIESRPVPGSPWEYIFYVDLRYDSAAMGDAAVERLIPHCRMVRELGRYAAAT